jgi:hypothetical protein
LLLDMQVVRIISANNFLNEGKLIKVMEATVLMLSIAGFSLGYI